MQDNDEQELPCSDKLSFDSAKEAETAALVAKVQRGMSLKVYKCKNCNLWHLSSS